LILKEAKSLYVWATYGCYIQICLSSSTIPVD
jgi:hypothetical protein